MHTLGTHGGLVVAHQRGLGAVRVRHHHGDRQTAARIAQLFEAIARQGHTQARHQHAGQVLFQPTHQLDRCRASRSEQHRRRARLAYLGQHIAQVLAIGGQSRLHEWLEALLCQKARGVFQHFAPISVVQVHDADVLEPHARQALYQAAHFVGVAGPHMEHVA